MKFLVITDCEKPQRKGKFPVQPKATLSVLELPGDKLPEGATLHKVEVLDIDFEDAAAIVNLQTKMKAGEFDRPAEKVATPTK